MISIYGLFKRLNPNRIKVIEPYLPRPYLQTKPLKWGYHQILNGIFYQLVNGCRWVDLPKDLPPNGTVYYWFSKWKKDNTWESISKLVFIHQSDSGKKKC